MPKSGTRKPLDPFKLVTLQFAAPASYYSGKIDLWIDDVEFIGSAPSALPRSCKPSGKLTPEVAGATEAQAPVKTATAGLPACDGCVGKPRAFGAP